MKGSDDRARVFEALAEGYDRAGELRRRDHCLVLAADAALAAGHPAEAERLRQRLLQLNPHHLLRPFATMSESLESPDVRDYVTDLRGQYPPELLERMQREAPTADEPKTGERPTGEVRTQEPVYKIFNEPTPVTLARPEVSPMPGPSSVSTGEAVRPRAASAVPPAQTTRTASPVAAVATPVVASDVTPGGYWMAMLLFVLGLLLAAGTGFIAFAWPVLRQAGLL